jgi:hypothetical protein
MFSRSISFSLQRVKTQERMSDLENERTKSRLSSKQKRGKNSAQRTALFCSKTNKSFARRSKIQKNSNEFYNRGENRKNQEEEVRWGTQHTLLY